LDEITRVVGVDAELEREGVERGLMVADEDIELLWRTSVGYRHAEKLPHDPSRVNSPALSPVAASRGLRANPWRGVTTLTPATQKTRLAVAARRLRRAAASGRIPTRRRRAQLFPVSLGIGGAAVK